MLCESREKLVSEQQCHWVQSFLKGVIQLCVLGNNHVQGGFCVILKVYHKKSPPKNKFSLKMQFIRSVMFIQRILSNVLDKMLCWMRREKVG